MKLVMTIAGEIYGSIDVSFHGLKTAEERQEHIAGLVEWMKSQNEVIGEPEFYLDEVPSKVTLAVQLFDEEMDQHEPVNYLLREKHREHYRSRNISTRKPVKKEFPVKKDDPAPFTRPPAVYSNRNFTE